MRPSEQVCTTHPITEHLAALAIGLARNTLSDADLDKAALCYADWFAVAVAAAHDGAICVLRDHAAREGGASVATFLGTRTRGTASQAALINCAAAHLHDYDDVSRAWLGHPTAPVASAVWALAEREAADGQSALAALIAGVEVSGRLGASLGVEHYRLGWHSSSTIGAIGAAAGCASILRLDAQQTMTALGLAATRAAGLQVVFGTPAKPLQLAHAAQLGLHSAELARHGFSCAADVLEGARGFLSLHADEYDPIPLLAPRSGRPLIHDTVFKRHAACFGTHAPIEAARKLRARAELNASDIREIVLRVSQQTMLVCASKQPATGLESKFSAPFAVALALSGADTAALSSFSDETTQNRMFQALAARVSLVSDPDLEPRQAVLTVRMNDGSVLSAEGVAEGSGDEPSRERKEVRRKALALCGPILGEDAARMVDAVLNLRCGRLPALRPRESRRGAASAGRRGARV